jgi:hypothetical protein
MRLSTTRSNRSRLQSSVTRTRADDLSRCHRSQSSWRRRQAAAKASGVSATRTSRSFRQPTWRARCGVRPTGTPCRGIIDLNGDFWREACRRDEHTSPRIEIRKVGQHVRLQASPILIAAARVSPTSFREISRLSAIRRQGRTWSTNQATESVLGVRRYRSDQQKQIHRDVRRGPALAVVPMRNQARGLPMSGYRKACATSSLAASTISA